MRNNQPPREIVYDPHEDTSITSIFPTIQGEGPFAGRRAVFVRFAGCNLQCPMCDTLYGEKEAMSTEDIVAEVRKHAPRYAALVVITGGEPFRQPAQLQRLTERLLNRGFDVQVETNGTTFQYLDPLVTVVVSPKTAEIAAGWRYRESFADNLYYKYVLHHRHVSLDGLPTTALANRLEKLGSRVYRPGSGFPRSKIYVQPCDTEDPEIDKRNMLACTESCLEHGYKLGVQMHKIAFLP